MPNTEPKTVTLPDREDMLTRLVSINDDPYTIERFYPLLLSKAGTELIGSGVVLMLHLAIHDYTEGMPSVMKSVMAMSVPDYIDALIDDPEVKADALQTIEQANAQTRANAEARPPAPSRTVLDEQDKVDLMRHIKHLAEVYDDCVTDSRNVSQAYRDGGANPYYNQVQTGLYLEFYYGGPSKVWTPWGQWHFGAAQRYETDLEAFMARLTVRTHIAEHNTDMGCIGPVYELLAIDGVALPEPSLLADRRQEMSYQESKDEWERLFANN